MDRREGLIFERFQHAEELRKAKNSWRQQSLRERYNEKLEEMRAVEKFAELQLEAKLAYRFREGRKMINTQKKLLEDRIQNEILKLKVRQELVRQEQKLKRSQRPKRPIGDPLPYLNKRKPEIQDDCDDYSNEIVEISVPKLKIRGQPHSGTPVPSQDVYIRYRHKRHISPDIIRFP
jgi:hypothetical protein